MTKIRKISKRFRGFLLRSIVRMVVGIHFRNEVGRLVYIPQIYKGLNDNKQIGILMPKDVLERWIDAGIYSKSFLISY